MSLQVTCPQTIYAACLCTYNSTANINVTQEWKSYWNLHIHLVTCPTICIFHHTYVHFSSHILYVWLTHEIWYTCNPTKTIQTYWNPYAKPNRKWHILIYMCNFTSVNNRTDPLHIWFVHSGGLCGAKYQNTEISFKRLISSGVEDLISTK